MQHENCNFTENFSKKEKRYFREILIHSVLGTDMFQHRKHVQKLKHFVTIAKPYKQGFEFKDYNQNERERVPRGDSNNFYFVLFLFFFLFFYCCN